MVESTVLTTFNEVVLVGNAILCFIASGNLKRLSSITVLTVAWLAHTCYAFDSWRRDQQSKTIQRSGVQIPCFRNGSFRPNIHLFHGFVNLRRKKGELAIRPWIFHWVIVFNLMFSSLPLTRGSSAAPSTLSFKASLINNFRAESERIFHFVASSRVTAFENSRTDEQEMSNRDSMAWK